MRILTGIIRAIYPIGVIVLSLGGVLYSGISAQAESLLPPPPPQAERAPTDTSSDAHNLTFSADSVHRDEENNRTIIGGDVEVLYRDHRLRTDVLIYDHTNGMLDASGDVILTYPNGDIIRSDHVVLRDDFRQGIIDTLQVLLNDGGRIAAQKAHLSAHRQTYEQALFTSCAPCVDNPDADPLWQIKAVKITFDDITHKISYEKATLEISGVPVAYVPYFFAYDSTVKRRSGFLLPSIRSSEKRGQSLSLPYFHTLSDSSDITLTPVLYTKNAATLEIESRTVYDRGNININTYTTTDSYGLRNYVTVRGLHAINSMWRTGYDLALSSDTQYLREYDYNNNPALSNHIYVEGFGDNSYVLAEALAFQSMRSNIDNGTLPITAPLMEYVWQDTPGDYGEAFGFKLSSAFLTRSTGVSSYRITLNPHWNINQISSHGGVWSANVSLNASLYKIEDFTPQAGINITNNTGNDTISQDYTVSQIVPKAQLNWKLPLVQRTAHSPTALRHIIAPILSLNLSPNKASSSKIPNEDSQYLNLDETTLFRLNQFSGYDRYDTGIRLDYGFEWSLYGNSGGYSRFFLGQSYHASTDDMVVAGYKGRLSDFITTINIVPGETFNLSYRGRLDKNTGKVLNTEFSLNSQFDWINLDLRYLYMDSFPTDIARKTFEKREFISINTETVLTETWRSNFLTVRDLDAGKLRSILLSFTYEDECFLFSAGYDRRLFHDGNITPETRFLFDVEFKTSRDE